MQLRFGNSFRFNVYLQIRWFVYKGCFIPHSKLKDKLRELVQPCFIKKNVQRRYKYLVQGRDRSYFVKKKKITLWFYQKVILNWYHHHARVVDWQHICFLWWTCFQPMGINSFRRLVPLFVWGRLHTGVSQEKRK